MWLLRCGGGPLSRGLRPPSRLRAAFPASPAAAATAGTAAAAGSLRCFASITASEARQGNWLIVDGRRVEVTEFRLTKSGRGAASVSLSYVDLETLKSGSQAFSVQKKLEKIEPEKHVLQVMYVDAEGGVVVLADSDFEEVRVPLRLFGGPAVAEQLTPELQVPVLMHQGEALKVQLPPSILAALRGSREADGKPCLQDDPAKRRQTASGDRGKEETGDTLGRPAAAGEAEKPDSPGCSVLFCSHAANFKS
ncbi:hypothetical protein Efla_003762 [Eimeria flavescens]